PIAGHPFPATQPKSPILTASARRDPRLAPALNVWLSTALPAGASAKRGAACAAMWPVFHMTGFDAEMRVLTEPGRHLWEGWAAGPEKALERGAEVTRPARTHFVRAGLGDTKVIRN
ncbi:hypothetical protein, partial [Delftia acidovorans]|uniref:hypothetical protein n=1 Tax=Delftia acidovorans TaxID=80866 RepID=UPI002FDCD8FC